MATLVTGSSRGIGKAIAKRLALAGHSLVLHASKESPDLHSTANLLGGAVVGTVIGDLSDPRNVFKVYDSARGLAMIDRLVNNAGVYLQSEFASASDAEFEAVLHKTMAVNFESPLRLMKLFIADAVLRGEGKIVNVASRVGFRGEPGAAVYAASKAALINVTRSLAVELAPKNIQLFGIAPGWVDTAMARDGMDDRIKEILAGIPLGRMASPEDCAATVDFLLSPDAGYLSGVVIDINGGSYFH